MRRIIVLAAVSVVIMGDFMPGYAQTPVKNSMMFGMEGGLGFTNMGSIADVEQDIVDASGYEAAYRNSSTGLVETYPIEFTYSTWRLGASLRYFTGARTALGFMFRREFVRQTQTIDIKVDEVMANGLMTYSVFGPLVAWYVPVRDYLVAFEASGVFGSGTLTRIPNYAEYIEPDNYFVDEYNEATIVNVWGGGLDIGVGKTLGSLIGMVHFFYAFRSMTLEEEAFLLGFGTQSIDYPEEELVHQVGVRMTVDFFSMP